MLASSWAGDPGLTVSNWVTGVGQDGVAAPKMLGFVPPGAELPVLSSNWIGLVPLLLIETRKAISDSVASAFPVVKDKAI